MKILFLTTYNVSIEHEHYFTQNVWKGLCEFKGMSSDNELCMASIYELDKESPSMIKQEVNNEHPYFCLYYSSHLTIAQKVEEIKKFFIYIAPSVIHSNMIETYDVQAAKCLSIPIVITVHIGGVICPRGGGNGFLMYNDKICNQKVGKTCIRCIYRDLPFPGFAELLHYLIPPYGKSLIRDKIQGKQIFYLTPFIERYFNITGRQAAIEIFQYATIIAANRHLQEILNRNGLKENVVMLPHGVQERPHIPMPDIDGKIRLGYLGRIQYSKGIHILLEALKGIDKDKYELHIIGDAEKDGNSRRYQQKVDRMAKNLNVIFHGRLPNSEIDAVIGTLHMLIHPAIFLEVYGLTIAEFLSIGRPVLATRCGGAEEQITDNVNGWLVEPNNVPALRAKIESLIKDKERIMEAAQHCRIPHPLPEYIHHLYEIYQQKVK